jgi:putative ABC transport system permease protein
MAETLLLSFVGGALGLFLASYGVDGIVAFLADQLPRSTEIHLDAWVLAFTLAASVATGVLAGMAPAWHLTKADVADSLKQGLGRTDADSGGRRTRNALVVSEVALSLVLLVGAGLLIRSLWLLRRIDPGFEARNVVTMSVVLPRTRYTEPARRSAFFDQALERIRALPGVESVGAVGDLPLTGNTSNWPVAIEGRPPVPVSLQPNVVTTEIAGDFFRALRIPLRRGRVFSGEDRADSPTVIVISEAMAKRFWPGEDPIGRRLTAAFLPDKICQVIGVVGDVKQRGLDFRDPVPAMYLTHEQVPSIGMDFAIRAAAPSVASAAVAAIHAMDPGQPVLKVGTMDQILAGSLSRQRLTMLLLAAFAGLALILAAVGISSVLSYGVRRRGREIGIRMALGAVPADILRMMILDGMRPALIGMAIGLAAAFALGRVLSGLIFGVSAADPATFAAVAAILAAVALIACLAPARRATRVHPLRALREE